FLPLRTQALLHDLRGHLHVELLALRARPQSSPAGVLPGSARRGRGRVTAYLASYLARKLPERKAWHGHGDLRDGRSVGAHHRPHPGWLDHGQLQLALDFPHQHSRGSNLAGAYSLSYLRSTLPRAEELPRGGQD